MSEIHGEAELFDVREEGRMATIQDAAGLESISNEIKSTHYQWLVYFSVNDMDHIIKKAQSLGAQLIIKNKYNPNIGLLATLMCPDGKTISMIERV